MGIFVSNALTLGTPNRLLSHYLGPPLPSFLRLPIDILSELFRFSFVLYSETRKIKRRKTNVKLQNRKTDYSTQKPTSLKSPVHRLTDQIQSLNPATTRWLFLCFQVGVLGITETGHRYHSDHMTYYGRSYLYDLNDL